MKKDELYNVSQLIRLVALLNVLGTYDEIQRSLSLLLESDSVNIYAFLNKKSIANDIKQVIPNLNREQTHAIFVSIYGPEFTLSDMDKYIDDVLRMAAFLERGGDPSPNYFSSLNNLGASTTELQ